jgi:small-conductance mechanosensitive channel
MSSAPQVMLKRTFLTALLALFSLSFAFAQSGEAKEAGGALNTVDAAAPSGESAAARTIGQFVEHPPSEKFLDTVHALQTKLFENKQWLWLIVRIAIAIALCVAVTLLLRFINFLFQKLSSRLLKNFSIKPEVQGRQFLFIKFDKIPFLKNLFKTNIFEKIFHREQLKIIISYIIKILKLTAMLVILYIALTAILGLFAPTRGFAVILLGYIWQPLKTFLSNFVHYLPDLFFIIVTIFIVRYIIRIVRFFTLQIEKNHIVIPGFHSDWALPTFKLLQIFIYALTLAVIYPRLPNANSDAFRGVSVLFGLVVSFGSSSAIGNLVAGIVITYMRTFKIGDFIKIGDVSGFVVEKSGIVTRLRTVKNEYVTFPNITVLTSQITNYNTSTETEKGLLIYKKVGVGYGVHWRLVNEMLVSAALKTEYIESDPPPFVNQTELGDYYCVYEINAYTKRADIMPRIITLLFQNIQDEFIARNIPLCEPHLRGIVQATTENSVYK